MCPDESVFVNPRLTCSFLRVSLAFPQGFGHFLNFMFFLPVSPSKFQVEDGAELKEQMSPYHDSRAMTRSPSPCAWTPGFPGSPAEGEGHEGFPPPPDKDLESPPSRRLEALVPSRASGLRWVWRNGRGPHLEGRQEPQASSPRPEGRDGP